MKLEISPILTAAQLLALALAAPAIDHNTEHQQNILPTHDGTIPWPETPQSLDLPLPSLFENTLPSTPSPEDQETTAIPSRYKSTLLARRLLALSSHGDLITVFPSNASSRIPSSVAHTPIGLPEYIASCEEPSGNPTILSLKISTATRNAQAGSNVSLSLSWWDEYIHITGKKPWAMANLPRLSLTGYLEEISGDEVSEKGIEGCFLKSHRDSVLWLPGRKWAAHEGFWTRLVVMQAYWIGGFGDTNYIGWLDPEEWRSINKEDWEGVRLPGEKE